MTPAVTVTYTMDDGSKQTIDLAGGDAGGTPPVTPPSGYQPSVPANIREMLEPTPVFDDRFTALRWGEDWAPTWFGGNSFNGMTLNRNLITLNSGGGVKLDVQNNGRTGCFMVTNPQNGDCKGFTFRYGYDEADAIIPANAAWPSLWNNGFVWPSGGEHDIVELIYSANQFSSNFHDEHNGNPRAQNSGPIAGNWAGQRVKYGGLRLPDGTAKGYWNGNRVGPDYKVNDKGAPHYLLQSIGDKDRNGAGGMIVFRRTVWLVKQAVVMEMLADQDVPDDAADEFYFEEREDASR